MQEFAYMYAGYYCAIASRPYRSIIEEKLAESVKVEEENVREGSAETEIKVEEQEGSEGGSKTTKIPGRAQSRINIANGRTRFTPLRESGEPVSAGFDHVLEQHFDRDLKNSRSVFSITSDELKAILQTDSVVHSSVSAIPGGQYVREVDVGQIVGNTALKFGGEETSWYR